MNLFHFAIFSWLTLADLAARSCKIWLSNSKLPGVGQGVFAGRHFKEGSTITKTRELQIRREVIEQTPLWNYAFHLQHGKVMSVLLGAASMLNHGAEMVNVRFSISEAVIEVVADRDIEEGEELFTSYGSEDWFLDRHIEYKRPDIAEIHNLRYLPGEFSGACLDTLAPDTFSETIVTAAHISAGDTIQSPFFLIPRWLAEKAEVTSRCYGHPGWDIVLLPFLLPGSLEASAVSTEANVVYSVNFDAEVERQQLHDTVNTFKSSGMLHIKALRDILPGEKLVAKVNAVEMHSAVGFQVSDLPAHWEAVHFWQSQVSAAEAGDAESQFKVAEAFRLGLRGQDVSGSGRSGQNFDALGSLDDLDALDALNAVDALAWYRRAAKQGHLEAIFRAGALIHDFLNAGLHSQTPNAPTNATTSGLAKFTKFDSQKEVPAALEAADWFSKASDRGHVRAQLLLAEMNIDGKFLPQNLSAAAFWGRKALASGASRVSAFCETFYEISVASGSSAKSEDRSAEFFWLQVAAEAGSPEAQYILGQGLGDTPEALNFLRQAATQGHADAAFALGVASLEGPSQNISAAVSWFRVAASKGHGAAQYNLGIALKNAGASDEADYWFKKAAANGFQGHGWYGFLQHLQTLQNGMWKAAAALRSFFSS